MGNACCGTPEAEGLPPARHSQNKWGAYSKAEADLYQAAVDNDAARAAAILAIPGVRHDGYRHARVRTTLFTHPPPATCGPNILTV